MYIFSVDYCIMIIQQSFCQGYELCQWKRAGAGAQSGLSLFARPLVGTVPMKQTNKKTRVEKQESKGERENAPICS